MPQAVGLENKWEGLLKIIWWVLTPLPQICPYPVHCTLACNIVITPPILFFHRLCLQKLYTLGNLLHDLGHNINDYNKYLTQICVYGQQYYTTYSMD